MLRTPDPGVFLITAGSRPTGAGLMMGIPFIPATLPTLEGTTVLTGVADVVVLLDGGVLVGGVGVVFPFCLSGGVSSPTFGGCRGGSLLRIGR